MHKFEKCNFNISREMLKMHKMYKFPGKVGIFFAQTFPRNLYILCIFNISGEMLKLQFFKLVHL